MTQHVRDVKFSSSVGPPGELWLRCWHDGVTVQLRYAGGIRTIALSTHDAITMALHIVNTLGKEVLNDHNSVP